MRNTILILALSAICIAGNLHAQLLGTPPETPAERQARLIVESVESSKNVFLGEFRHTFRLLWESPDPQAVLDVMQAESPGSPARLFGINSRLTQFLLAELTIAGDTAAIAEVQALLATLPPFEVNEETGAVTILAPEPTPTPAE